jgi:predicted PurR-regulated permease PerM
MSEVTRSTGPRRTARYQIGLAALAAAGLFIVWRASDALLLIFAAVLFAAFLDELSRLLGKVLALAHGVRLAIVCATIGLVLAAAIAWGGAALAMQANEFTTTLREQFTPGGRLAGATRYLLIRNRLGKRCRNGSGGNKGTEHRLNRAGLSVVPAQF